MIDLTHDSYQIQVRQRGQVTIPRKLREELGIAEGDVLTVMPVGDSLVLVPNQLRSPQLTEQMADLLESSGLTLADLLQELPRIREELVAKRYGTIPTK